jgi:hypothetical protein
LDGDTSFCFTITQSKQIAKKIVSNNYCDSVTIVQDEKIGLLNALTENKDSTITNLKWKIVNLNTMQKNNKTSIGHYEKTIATQKKLLKRSQFHKMLLSVGLGVVTVIAIAK